MGRLHTRNGGQNFWKHDQLSTRGPQGTQQRAVRRTTPASSAVTPGHQSGASSSFVAQLCRRTGCGIRRTWPPALPLTSDLEQLLNLSGAPLPHLKNVPKSSCSSDCWVDGRMAAVECLAPAGHVGSIHVPSKHLRAICTVPGTGTPAANQTGQSLPRLRRRAASSWWVLWERLRECERTAGDMGLSGAAWTGKAP